MISNRIVFGCAVTLLIAAGGSPAPGQAQGLGIAAGANFNQLEDIEDGGLDAPFESSTGYHVGVFLQMGGGGLSFRPGVAYHKLGTYEFPTGEEIDLSAVEVSGDLLLSFVPQSPVSPYLLGGPVITFPQSDNDAAEEVALTVDVGAGIMLDMSRLVLMPEIRYSMGVTDYLSDEFTVGDVTVRPSDDGQRLSKVMVRLNLIF